jgi:hypothetical protein
MSNWDQGVFFSSILWCNWSDKPPQEALARVGFILDMKVERNSESFYIFGHLLGKFSLKIWRIWDFLFFLVPSYEIWQNFTKTRIELCYWAHYLVTKYVTSRPIVIARPLLPSPKVHGWNNTYPPHTHTHTHY